MQDLGTRPRVGGGLAVILLKGKLIGSQIQCTQPLVEVRGWATTLSHQDRGKRTTKIRLRFLSETAHGENLRLSPEPLAGKADLPIEPKLLSQSSW